MRWLEALVAAAAREWGCGLQRMKK